MSYPGVAELAEFLGVPVAIARHIARRSDCPLLDKEECKEHKLRGFRFRSLEAVRKWLDGNRASLIEQGPGCARFVKAGWLTGLVCKPCSKTPLSKTATRRRIGPHVRVTRQANGRVRVSCWCSAKLAVVPASTVPAEDLKLIPEKGRKRRAA